jgi:hypothetical protein
MIFDTATSPQQPAEYNVARTARSIVQHTEYANIMLTHHPPGSYDRPSDGRFFSPFNLQADPMKRLLLINFERDPDPVYVGFEPQLFENSDKGRGLLVIGWRKDGRVDVYHQPTLTLKREDYDIVGKGLADFVERPLEDARFEIGPRGVDTHITFADKDDRPVTLRIRESNPSPRKPFSLLGPFPSSTEKSPSLPLALLYDFYFVRRSGTEVEISIDGRHHKPDTLPVPMDGTWIYFLRYSSDPFILTWNEAYEGALSPLPLQAAGTCEQQGVIYDLEENTGHLELRGMRPAGAHHDVRFRFNPAFPDIASLRDGIQLNGDFVVDLEESMGRIEGTYTVSRSGSQVTIEVHPRGGWRPGVRKWSVRLIFLIVPLFKSWPKSYRWTATVDLSDEDVPVMTSRWERES